MERPGPDPEWGWCVIFGFTDTEVDYLIVAVQNQRNAHLVGSGYLAMNAESANAADYPDFAAMYERQQAAEQERADTYADILRKLGVDPDAQHDASTAAGFGSEQATGPCQGTGQGLPEQTGMGPGPMRNEPE